MSSRPLPPLTVGSPRAKSTLPPKIPLKDQPITQKEKGPLKPTRPKTLKSSLSAVNLSSQVQRKPATNPLDSPTSRLQLPQNKTSANSLNSELRSTLNRQNSAKTFSANNVVRDSPDDNSMSPRSSLGRPAISPNSSPRFPSGESKTKGKRPTKSSKSKRLNTKAKNTKAGTLRFFGKGKNKEIDSENAQDDLLIGDGAKPSSMKQPMNTDFSRNSVLIANALLSRKPSPREGTGQSKDILISPRESSLSTGATTESDAETTSSFVKVGSSFSKTRVARVEFGPENTTKAINVTTRTSPLEAFEGMMNKISKGLPPERRDTLVAKYAKYTLYRQFDNGELEKIYSDEPLLSPMQVMEGGVPKFLFTDQKVDARTRDGEDISSINLGSVMQETHMKEEQKADNAVDEILITERKFLFDTDLMIEMVIKPICEEDIIPDKTRKKIFLNIQQINSFHRELYRRFQIDNSISGIAAVFSDTIIEYLGKVYTTYLGYYENALEVFYQTRDHSEKFRKFLSRVAENPALKDKSLNNLLVTPMQRVCKYELLLKNVISQEKKRSSPDVASIRACERIINQLNITLQRIDKRRIESDEWEKILRLEEKLNLSEPLRKRGRVIVAEGNFKTTRRVITGDTVSRVCSVILFNDLLLRSYKSNKTGEFKVLDISPLNHLVLVDPQQSYAAVNNTITLCNIDPRGAVLEFYFGSAEEREEWYQFLAQYTIPMNRVCSEWGIPAEGSSGTEVIFAVDNCSWYEAYIERCRILVTRYYVILAWENFGMTQKELIPLESITDIEGSKDNSEILKTNLWKENYLLKKFNNHSSTAMVLRSAWQNFKRESKTRLGDNVTVEGAEEMKESSWMKQFSISKSDEKKIWNAAKKRKAKEGSVVLQSDVLNDKLFIIRKGVLIKSEMFVDDIQVLSCGDMFGIASFLDDTKVSSYKVTAGLGGATYAYMTRAELTEKLSKDPNLLVKLFATLARLK